MTSRQAVGEELAGPEEMGEIGPREPPAGQAATVFLDGPRVVAELLVAEIESTAGDPGLAVAGDARREDRVEQVDAPVDGLQEVERASRVP